MDSSNRSGHWNKVMKGGSHVELMQILPHHVDHVKEFIFYARHNGKQATGMD